MYCKKEIVQIYAIKPIPICLKYILYKVIPIPTKNELIK